MPDGAAMALPSSEERRRAATLRASRRPLPTAIPSATTPEEEESDEGPAFGEEGFGEEGAESAAKQQAAPPADVAREAQQKQTRQGAALAAEKEVQAARQFETERLTARRGARTDGAAEKAKAEASERARKEMAQKATQYLLRGAKIGTSVTVVMLIVTFAIMNLQLFLINGLRGGKPVELGGLQIPKLDQWEVILVIVIDLLAIVANPIVLGIIIFVTIVPGLRT